MLDAWHGSGDEESLQELVPLIYDELRALAARRLRGERPDHTLQATALVHEAYARLIDGDVDFGGRAHFFALAATTMRRVLVDHARKRNREKRGGGRIRVTLADDDAALGREDEPLLELEEALSGLARRDARKARVVELHFFGGLTYAQTAAVLGISEATVDRDLRMAKAWLATEMSVDGPA